MSDNRDQPQGGYDPQDPWAPPNRDGVEMSKGASASASPSPAPQPAPPSVHDQQTVVSMPSVEVPPPPVAPGGPAATTPGYGYPAATPPAGSYGYPAATPPPAASGYGYPTPAPAPAYGAGYGQSGWAQQPSNGMGTASMVLGIIAVAGFCMYGLGIILGILALIFGIIGLKKAGRGEATNRGMALAGVILGSIGILVSAVFIGLIVWAAVDSNSYTESDSGDVYGNNLILEITRP